MRSVQVGALTPEYPPQQSKHPSHLNNTKQITKPKIAGRSCTHPTKRNMSSNCNNNGNNRNTCASPSCRHTCRVCGHKRCYCPRCGPLRFDIRIVSSTRRRRDPSMNWRKILARPKCCRCLQRQPKPIHFIDLIEKERLTSIEFAAFKKEDDATPTRRPPPRSPEEHDRLKEIILKNLTRQSLRRHHQHQPSRLTSIPKIETKTALVAPRGSR
jgi:hypothetical protein